MSTFSISSIFSIFLNIEEPYIEESILKNSIFSICIENIDRGSSIPNTPLDGIDRTKVVIYWLVQVDIDYTPEWHFFNSVSQE